MEKLKIYKLLRRVEKPARYIGGEAGSIVKSNPSIRFAFAFPDVYEIGMSYLGLQIIYDFINKREDSACERVFMPWVDMARLMRENKVPLFALESQEPISSFNFMGFTLQHEAAYTNVLAMLNLAGLSPFSSERGEDAPIICAGGPCCVNPEPMADFIDFFYIGDIEANFNAILNKYKKGVKKTDFLRSIANLEGVYVPFLYEPIYSELGFLKEFKPKEGAPSKIKKVVASPNPEPINPIIPSIETSQFRAAVELFRGCKHGCRFCQAGYIHNPVRFRKREEVAECARSLLKATGHEELSLLSLSSSDYPDFLPLLGEILEYATPKNISVSLPSLRIDAVTAEALKKTASVRKSSVTFAPEAGSQRMRNVIGKNISHLEIIDGAWEVFDAGFDSCKLYFMLGLPTETEDDLRDIIELARCIRYEYITHPKREGKNSLRISLSVACFIPKPHTPFQWEAMDDESVLRSKQKIIKEEINKNDKKFLTYRYHDASVAKIEAILARGDRRIGSVIYEAWRAGQEFCGWSEFFDASVWESAFDLTEVNPDFYLREIKTDELLAWDFIDVGTSKNLLLRERASAYEAAKWGISSER